MQEVPTITYLKADFEPLLARSPSIEIQDGDNPNSIKLIPNTLQETDIKDIVTDSWSYHDQNEPSIEVQRGNRPRCVSMIVTKGTMPPQTHSPARLRCRVGWLAFEFTLPSWVLSMMPRMTGNDRLARTSISNLRVVRELVPGAAAEFRDVLGRILQVPCQCMYVRIECSSPCARIWVSEMLERLTVCIVQ